MPDRNHPYGAFNFTVEIDAPETGNGGPISGHFSDVSGLGNEINYSDYRAGDDPDNVLRKIPNTNKTDEVTLKRGLIDADVFGWFTAVRDGNYVPRTVAILIHDEAHNPVLEVRLLHAQPKKWAGPTLAGKAGADVAMEELHLVHEGIVFGTP